jgi:hypothetical protein
MPRQALGQALWRFLVAHPAYRQGVVANHNVTIQAEIRLGGARLLTLPGVAGQVPVQLLPAAVEVFDRVIAP